MTGKPLITALSHEEARDTEIVFRALLACKGRFDARLILDATAATLTKLQKAGRIAPHPNATMQDCRVEIVKPAMYVRRVSRLQSSPPRGMRQTWDEWQVVQGRRVLFRHDLRHRAEGWRAWRDVKCPACGVEPGRSCVEPRKVRSGVKVIMTTWPHEEPHAARVEAAKKGKLQ